MSVLAPADMLIIAAYFIAAVALGIWKGRGESNTEDFVAGGRQMPWWAVLGSIIATEISAATYIAVPAAAFDGDFSYLQFGIGSMLGRVAVAYLLLGAFYRHRVLTVYEFLAKRFGSRSRYMASGMFLGGRLLASSLRLMMATTALALIFDVPVWLTIVVFTLAAVAYTYGGGIKAVIWTDLLQAGVFVGAGVCFLAFLQNSVGWSEIVDTGAELGKTRIFRWLPEEGLGLGDWLQATYVFPLAVLFGFLTTLAALGTDQDMTQRMLTCRDVGSARRSVILSGLTIPLIVPIFLFIGLGIYIHFTTIPEADQAALMGRDAIPQFIRDMLPVGLKGLVVTGLVAAAMSSLDSALGALSSSAVVDFYHPLFKREADQRHLLRMARSFVVLFALIIAVAAWLFRNTDDFLGFALQMASIPAGPLLGVFLAAVLTRRGSDSRALIALLSGITLAILCFIIIHNKVFTFGWTWVIVFTTSVAYMIVALAPKNSAIQRF